jgi:hypothetical protein
LFAWYQLQSQQHFSHLGYQPENKKNLMFNIQKKIFENQDHVLFTTFAPLVTGRHKMVVVRASTIPDKESA